MCDLCGSDEYEVIWDKSDHPCKSAVIEKDGKIIQGRNVICKRCGLVYVWPRMSKEELDDFYANDYRKIYGEGSIEAEKNHARNVNALLRPLVDDNILQLPAKGKMLDIGCSTGELVARVGGGYGIEPNKEHYEIAKAKGLNVENTTIEEYNPGFKFDIITMLNALEHVISPTDTLNKIHSLLNDDGYVLISVPNLYNRTIFLPMDTFLSNAHLYNFSEDILLAYFIKCGFKIVAKCHVVEEMGDKLYFLGQKTEPSQPQFTPADIEMTKNHLLSANEVWELKQIITLNGFR